MKGRKYSNLSVKNKEASELQSGDDTVITDANKGSAVVTLEVNNCIKETK